MMTWLAHILGLDNLSGPWYGFWSGFGSDISELALVGALIGLVRKSNCETRGCWRLGRHPWIDPATGQTHKLCRRCHPRDHLTRNYIRRSHNYHGTMTP